ncbi:MAG: hypothetical protein JNL19_14265 [Burkholderiales bacterium]|nr:hypothetical protein [Burkholderiales bacterium]
MRLTTVFPLVARRIAALGAMAVAMAAHAATFTGSGVGSIPDGTANASCPAPGVPLNITFAANGLTSSALTDIRVSMTFGTPHYWGGDITATLISPTGISFPLFGRIGATTATGVGTSANLSGTYAFVDPAITTNNIWTVASNSTSTVPILEGTYATTPVGGAGAVNPPAPTNFLAAFSGLTTASVLNGTWTLQVVDNCEMDTAEISAASLTLTQSAPPLQYSYAPTFIHFPTIPANTQSYAYPVVVFAPATNSQNIGFPANACVMSGSNPGDFMRLPDPLSVAPGTTGQLLVQFRPSSNGFKSATMTCTAQPSGVTPAQIIVQLDGAGGDPLPPPNCYDVDGDGVMNPLVDGLFIARLQLGLSPQAAGNNITFHSPRNSTKKVVGFMQERCGYVVPSTPSSQ